MLSDGVPGCSCTPEQHATLVRISAQTGGRTGPVPPIGSPRQALHSSYRYDTTVSTYTYLNYLHP